MKTTSRRFRSLPPHQNDQLPVFVGMSGVFDDGNDVGSLFGYVDEVTTGSVREFHSVDEAFRAYDVGDVRDRGSGSSTQV